MINKKRAYKYALLSVLRQNDQIVSSQRLSRLLRISRVSIWKHIRNLQDCGYDIAAGPQGYRLLHSPDTPYSWEFNDPRWQVTYVDEIDSTMIGARALARKKCPHFTVLVAGRQTRGRGRLKRVWHSDDGGLYFTVVLRPQLPPRMGFQINFAAAVALAVTLRESYHVPAGVKWPNDVLVSGNKISGMLSEMRADDDHIEYLNIGMGINVNNDPSDKEARAVSIRQLLGQSVSRIDLLATFLDRLDRQLQPAALESVVSQWKALTVTLGRPVKIVTYQQTIEGMALDVDDNGALKVRTPSGDVQTVIYGDCFHI